MISQGTPMFLMGDECGRTQHGNNNAYCQDNKSTWLDWERAEEFKDIYNFVKNMIKLRKSYSIFKRIVIGNVMIVRQVMLSFMELSFILQIFHIIP